MPAKKTEVGPDTVGDTRERLVTTAVRLFAERGVHGVSLRAVSEAAGAKNTGAVHYHFGDRENLLKAAVERVIAATNETVSNEEAGRLGVVLPDLRSELHARLASAFLATLTLPARYEWGSSGIRLLARVLIGDAQDMAAHVEAVTLEDSVRLTALLRPALPPLSEELLQARVDFAQLTLICGMASVSYLEAARSAASGQSAVSGADDLIDFIAGGLMGQGSSR